MANINKENKRSFCKRVKTFASPSELIRTKVCYMIAKHAHRAQKRKEKDQDGNNIRYFEHARRVAIILMDELDIRDPEMVQAALLHDTIEDCEDVDAALIEQTFGKRVAKIVISLTKTKANKETYYSNLKAAAVVEPEIAIIKAADRLDNLRTLHLCEKEFIAKQIKETKEVLLPLFQFVLDRAIEISRHEALSQAINKIYVEINKLSKLIDSEPKQA